MSVISKFKSLFICTCLIIEMTGIVPCFAYGPDLMQKTDLTVYEQYLKDYAQQIEKVYTPEKYFPQKEMEFVLDVDFKIQPDGSITDILVYNRSERYYSSDPFWFLRPVYYMRLTRLSRKHEQYIKDMLLNNKAKPFPENFGDNISVSLEFWHWNERFKNPIFKTTLKCRNYGFHNGPNNFTGPYMSAEIVRRNNYSPQDYK